MHQTRFSRLRVLSGSLLMGLLSALTLAATVLADGAGGVVSEVAASARSTSFNGVSRPGLVRLRTRGFIQT